MAETILVTGGAGFIGSHLVEISLKAGFKVKVIDSFLPNLYSAEIKKSNWQQLSSHKNVDLLEADICTAEISAIVKEADIIVNCAAMPGLMPSWNQFSTYLDSNVLVLSRILDQIKVNSPQKIIQISTSSVYGRVAIGNELSPTHPISPYGVTKLAAENLIKVVAEQKNLNFNILRLFSVYGPRQRPDMAYNIIIEKLLTNKTISIYGDGNATRSNTYVADVVQGILDCITGGRSGETYNICGNEEYSLNSVITMLENLTNRFAKISFLPTRPGDQAATKGDFSKASTDFHYFPRTRLAAGLTEQSRWMKAKDIS